MSTLHFLAHVASNSREYESTSSPEPSSSAGPSSPSTRFSFSASPPTSFKSDPHLSPNFLSVRPPLTEPLRPSSTTNHASPPTDAGFVQFIRHKTARKSRKTTDIQLRQRMQMKQKRKQLLEKATKIRSLDNSPVNERQLLVLRMVYDEITMYPCESWMVLIAIIINRAYKQVKNWFSNERQKNRTGESVPFETDDGDKVRLRTYALSICQEWSDAFFEEVVMIYNYRVLRQSRFNGQQSPSLS